MGFLKRLFGGEQQKKSGTGHVDPTGIYLYVKCGHCGTCVKLRADKKYDLQNSDHGYTWHKTIVDSKCFRRMTTVVNFDRNYDVVSAQLDGGEYITEMQYQNWLASQEAAKSGTEEAETKTVSQQVMEEAE